MNGTEPNNVTLAAVSTWLPPLPIVNEACALGSFLTTSADDLAEDMIKLVALVLVYRASTEAIQQLGCASDSFAHWLLLVCSVVALYPWVDHWADLAASILQPLQNDLARRFDIKPPTPEQPPLPAKQHDQDVMDEYVEDLVKTLCLWAHISVGAAVSDIIIPESVMISEYAAIRALGGAAKKVVALGTPAGQYAECDEYADRLGDLVGSALPVVPTTSILSPRASPAAFCTSAVIVLGVVLVRSATPATDTQGLRRLGFCLVLGAALPLAGHFVLHLSRSLF